MNSITKRLAAVGAGIAWTLIACVSAQAEDIEIFVGNNSPGNNANPNILFLFDDSISMDATVITQATYDPADTTITGSCTNNRFYWSTSGSPPTCGANNYFLDANFKCQAARNAIALSGFYQPDRYVSFRATSTPPSWVALPNPYTARIIECQDDEGIHGDGSSTTAVYPRNGSTTTLWAGATNLNRFNNWTSGTNNVSVYSGHYVNWYYGPTRMTTRIAVMQEVAVGLVNSLNGVNVGLMHFNVDDGGIVSHAMEDVATARATMATAINALTPTNYTPLEESLYEAYLYMTGGVAKFGGSGVASAFSDPAADIYDSPIDQTCQKSHIILLTDGEPRSDLDAAADILGVTDFSVPQESFTSLVGGVCDLETYPAGFVTGQGGHCLDELAEFMYEGDMSPLDGVQNITTHTIGFFVDLPNLVQTAARGGGQYYTADDTATLSTALTNIVTSILDTSSTFTAPSVSINAFNQTRHTNEIFVGLFRPSASAHWAGNLKKFRLRTSDSTIVDVNDNPIIDPISGTLLDTIQDFWSPQIDGASVTAGGAANLIPAGRNVYTYFGNADLTDVSNDIDLTNTSLTDSLLGTGLAGTPTRAELLAFINGWDTSDIDQDSVVAEPRHQMGDPLHSRPVVVVYGPDVDDADIDSLVFVGTNDGYLHAFDAEDGDEVWSFLPPEFLDEQVDLFIDNSSTSKIYGPDAGIRVQTISDNDGVIESAAGEKVYLFFGMRRGGDAYYALDITNPASPQVLWRKEPGGGTDAYGVAQLPGLGQTWATVTPARINIGSATQNTDKLVLVVPGGYDAGQDATSTSLDNEGNSIYILDMVSGNLLWRGSRTGATQNFLTPNWGMNYSFPADVRVMDLNGDGLADRMYAADMGGQVWRFDITNGNSASSLMAGGVIAQLGAAGMSTPTDQDTRRFYYAPDIARVVNQDYNFIHIGIGSGHRAHPNATVNHDEFYALRDYFTYTARTQAQYNTGAIIKVGDLVDVTTDLAPSVPQGSAGWRLSLNDGGWRGEKVLAEARTFAGEVFISTYRPGPNGTSCEPAVGTTRQYIVSLFDARPVNNLDGSADDYDGDGDVDPTDLQLTDRYREFEGPPPPETVFFFPGPEGDTDGDGDVDADDQQLTLSCLAQGNCLGETPCQGLRCFENGVVRFPVRTFWTQDFE